MSELRNVLENIQHQVRPRPGSLEQIHTRHRRRERTRRITAAAVAIVVGIAGVLTATQLLRFGERAVPAAPVIDGSNVTRLAPAWSRQVEGLGSSAPVVADGVLFAASDDGALYAIDARTGATVWVGAIPAGISTAPVVAGRTVLVEAGGALSAFDVDCGSQGAACTARWTASMGGANLASPTVVDQVAYVATSPGGLSAFPLGCSDPCSPVWTANYLHGEIAQSPAVVDGSVWDSSSHSLSAFPASCSGRCSALVHDVGPTGVELTSGPTVSAGVVYVGASDGRVYAFPTSCAAGGSCAPLWSGQTRGSIVGAPVVDAGRVFVGSNDGRAYAFPVACGSASRSCRPQWVGRTGGPISEPLEVEEGLVYASSTDGTIAIFPASCPSPRCPPLSTRSVGALPATPAIWAGRVDYTLNADGVLTAYTVDGAAI